jgi:hypothetical protein
MSIVINLGRFIFLIWKSLKVIAVFRTIITKDFKNRITCRNPLRNEDGVRTLGLWISLKFKMKLIPSLNLYNGMKGTENIRDCVRLADYALYGGSGKRQTVWSGQRRKNYIKLSILGIEWEDVKCTIWIRHRKIKQGNKCQAT